MIATSKRLYGACLVFAAFFALFGPCARADESAPAAPIETLLVTDNPLLQVNITVSPKDLSGFGSDTTDFIRDYAQGTHVTLTAPSTANTGSGTVSFVRR